MPVDGACGVETLADSLKAALLANENLNIVIPALPDIPAFYDSTSELFTQAPKITNEDLTTGVVGGTGVFDVIMTAMTAHLDAQHQKGRITGKEYAEAYTQMTVGAMSQAVQFLLGRDQAFFAAARAQIEAIRAIVEMETVKLEYKKTEVDVRTGEAAFALTKMKLSTEAKTFCIAEFNLDNMLPQQLQLLEEQYEQARAQTLDTRSDGITPVAGSVGKQKDLYTQQIESYKRADETKVMKIFTDAWLTQKTLDEGLLPPTEFANANLDLMLSDLATNVGLG